MIKAFSPRERVSRSLHLWLCSSNKWRRLIKVVFTLERISKIANMRWHKTDTRPKLTPGLNSPFDDCCNDVFPLLERLTCNPGINTEVFPVQNSFHSLSKIYYRCKHPSSGTWTQFTHLHLIWPDRNWTRKKSHSCIFQSVSRFNSINQCYRDSPFSVGSDSWCTAEGKFLHLKKICIRLIASPK